MALKLFRVHAVATGQPHRDRVISLMPGYHGATAFTLGLNGDRGAPALWGPLTMASEKIPAPLTFRAESPEAAARATLAALEETIGRIGADRVLALVVEPIGGQASGVNVPHSSFLPAVRTICDQHGIKLVYDEIVTAFRTGKFLAAHHEPAARPDAVVLAKGLAAGYAPLGACLVSAAVAEELAATTGFVVSHSYDASPIACAAGSAVLDVVVDQQLIPHADRTGGRLRAGLDRLKSKWPMIGDVRGRGLLLAIELVADPETLAKFPAEIDPGAVMLRHGLAHGLLLYSRRQNGGYFGDWLLIAPPLVIDAAIADELIARLDSTLASAEPELQLGEHNVKSSSDRSGVTEEMP